MRKTNNGLKLGEFRADTHCLPDDTPISICMQEGAGSAHYHDLFLTIASSPAAAHVEINIPDSEENAQSSEMANHNIAPKQGTTKPWKDIPDFHSVEEIHEEIQATIDYLGRAAERLGRVEAMLETNNSKLAKVFTHNNLEKIIKIIKNLEFLRMEVTL